MTKKINERWNKIGLNTTEPHQRKIERMYDSYWWYMVDHALMCTTANCICKASTFQDMMADMKRLVKDEFKVRDLQEALDQQWVTKKVDYKWVTQKV